MARPTWHLPIAVIANERWDGARGPKAEGIGQNDEVVQKTESRNGE
jgi:hypothetical protein